jgi:hypothetical protein
MEHEKEQARMDPWKVRSIWADPMYQVYLSIKYHAELFVYIVLTQSDVICFDSFSVLNGLGSCTADGV